MSSSLPIKSRFRESASFHFPKKVHQETHYEVHMGSLSCSPLMEYSSIEWKKPPYQGSDQKSHQRKLWDGTFVEKIRPCKLSQTSHLKIKRDFAAAQGLPVVICDRLKAKVGMINEKSFNDLMDFFFDSYSEASFEDQLRTKLSSLSLEPQALEALFHEMKEIRKELLEHTRSDNVYVYAKDETTLLTHPSPVRINVDSRGNVIYSTGTITSKAHAKAIIEQMAQSMDPSLEITVSSDDDIPTLSFPIVVESSSHHISAEEEKLLKELEKEPFFIIRNSKLVRIKPTWIFFEAKAGLKGNVSPETVEALKQVCRNRYPDRPDMQGLIDTYIELLGKTLSEREQLLYRATICQLLNIPYHVLSDEANRCSKIVSLKKGIHQWLSLTLWKAKMEGTSFSIGLPETFMKSHAFLAHVEAAFFEELMILEQAHTMAKMVTHKQNTVYEALAPTTLMIQDHTVDFPLSTRYLRNKSLIERIFKTIFASLFSIIAFAFLLAISIPLMIVLCAKYKGKALEVAGHLVLFITLLPFFAFQKKAWKSSPTKELEKDMRSHQIATPHNLQSLFQAAQRLSPKEQKAILQCFEKVPEDLDLISPEAQHLFRQTIQHWKDLKLFYAAGGALPPLLQEMVNISYKKPIFIFKLIEDFNESFFLQLAEKVDMRICSNEVDFQMIRTPPRINEYGKQIAPQFESDVHRASYTVYVNGRGSKQLHGGEENKKQKIQNIFSDLEKLSIIEKEPQLLLAVQELLSQKNEVSCILNTALSGLRLGPGQDDHYIDVQDLQNSDNLHYQIWQNSDHSITVRVSQERMLCDKKDPQDLKKQIPFTFSHDIVLAKNSQGQWVGQLSKVSFNLQLEKVNLFHAAPIMSDLNPERLYREQKLENKIHLLEGYMDALIKHHSMSKISLGELKDRISELNKFILENMSDIPGNSLDSLLSSLTKFYNKANNTEKDFILEIILQWHGTVNYEKLPLKSKLNFFSTLLELLGEVPNDAIKLQQIKDHLTRLAVLIKKLKTDDFRNVNPHLNPFSEQKKEHILQRIRQKQLHDLEPFVNDLLKMK